MATSSKQRLLEAADDLFYREGFHAVGLDRILHMAGVTKTTFYNNFESKDALILEMLRHHDRWWRETFMAKLREHGGDDPRSQLLALPALLRDLLSCDHYNGCIFINVAVEFPLPHDPPHMAAVEHKQQMEMIVRDIALRAGADDPIALAEELCLALEGAYVTQQVAYTNSAVDTLQRIVTTLVDRAIPAQGASQDQQRTGPISPAGT